MTHTQRIMFLKIAAEVLIGFGILMFLTLWTPVAELMVWFLDIAIWPFLDGTQVFEGIEMRLFVAISGGLSAGWGVMCYMIAEHVFRDDPKLGGRMIVLPIVTWFCVDSLGSVLAGAAPNAVLNIVFLVLFVLPVVWPSKEVGEVVSA